MLKLAQRIRIALVLVPVLMPLQSVASAIRATPAEATAFPANDDQSVQVALPFSMFYGGETVTSLWLNNNGNVTFSNAQWQYTPTSIDTGQPMIAPFFADVDTRGAGNNPVTYGMFDLGGRQALFINWLGVGYYASRSDRLNDFQLIITDRSDTGSGNFDLEYNYDRIEWETGNASGGSGGLGGVAARAGFSNGAGVAYEFGGSGIAGALLDGSPDSLVANSNVGFAGRYDFIARNGTITATPEPATFGMLGVALIAIGTMARRAHR